MRFTARIATAIVAGFAAVLAAAAPAQASTVTSGAQDGASLTAGRPETVVLDARTGQVLSVTPTAPTASTDSISNDQNCDGGDACYFSGKIPYAHQAFWGTTGAYYGSWPYRSGGYSGVYKAQFCWENPTLVCKSIFPPLTTFTFTGGTLVTGTAVLFYA